MMWRFVDHSEIELTNNLAERQIRKYVIYRKKSLFTWSQRGNEFVERIMSLFLTCRLQKQHSFLKLSDLIANLFANYSPERVQNFQAAKELYVS